MQLTIDNMAVSEAITLIFWVGTIFMFLVFCYVFTLLLLWQKKKKSIHDHYQGQLRILLLNLELLELAWDDENNAHTKTLNKQLELLASLVDYIEKEKLVAKENYSQYNKQMTDLFVEIKDEITRIEGGGQIQLTTISGLKALILAELKAKNPIESH